MKYRKQPQNNNKNESKMEKRNTLEYIQSELESLLEFNSYDPEIENAWAWIQDPANCPAGSVYLNILRNCMTEESFREYVKTLAAKYKKA